MTRHFDSSPEIAPVTWPVITRVGLAKYSCASGDWNAIHLDSGEAREAGLDDVIAHGMLTMAFLSQYARDAVPGRLRRIKVRFRAMVRLGDRVTCKTEAVVSIDGALKLQLVATNGAGEIVAAGEADIDVSDPNV